jgi:uncharacterized protein involved in exopolysaccharide biosynthesis
MSETSAMADAVFDHDIAPWQALRLNLRRNRRNMLLALLGCSMLGGTVAALMPATYRATAELMVRLGPEYLVNADPGSTSAFMERKEMVVSEVAILTAPALEERVIGEIGLARLYPSLADDIDASDPASLHDAQEEALRSFDRHLKVLPLKDSTLLSVAFTHRDAAMAAEVAQRLTADYLDSRKQYFGYSGGDARQAEVTRTRIALAGATDQLAQFRKSAGIADFEAQMTHLIDERGQVMTASDKAEADIPALAAQLDSLRGSLGAIGGWSRLSQQEGVGADTTELLTGIAKLKLRRTELALQFKDHVPQLDDIDRQLGSAQALLQASRHDRETKVITGRPTSFDAVETALQEAQSSLAAARARAEALHQQVAVIDSTIARLDSGRAELEQLQSEQKVNQDAFVQAAKRLNEGEGHDKLLDATKPNVEIVQAARIPYDQTLTRLIIAVMGVVLGTMMAALIAYIDGLGRARAPR